MVYSPPKSRPRPITTGSARSGLLAPVFVPDTFHSRSSVLKPDSPRPSKRPRTQSQLERYRDAQSTERAPATINTAEASQSHHEISPFLKLPPEIRNEVYKYLVPEEKDIRRIHRPSHCTRGRHHVTVPIRYSTDVESACVGPRALAGVNRQVRQEFLHLFNTSHTTHVHLEDIEAYIRDFFLAEVLDEYEPGPPLPFRRRRYIKIAIIRPTQLFKRIRIDFLPILLAREKMSYHLYIDWWEAFDTVQSMDWWCLARTLTREMIRNEMGLKDHILDGRLRNIFMTTSSVRRTQTVLEFVWLDCSARDSHNGGEADKDFGNFLDPTSNTILSHRCENMGCRHNPIPIDHGCNAEGSRYNPISIDD